MAQPFVGEIRQFAGNFAPQGWALCSGQLVSIAENDILFTLIGTTYGGDGQTTFALPNLQGRVPIHVGSGLPIGSSGGTESVTLNINQLPVHSHPVASSATGGSDSPANNVWGGAQSVAPYGASPGNALMNAASVGSSGGNQPHENRIPYVAVTYIIALYGIFPSQG